MRLLAALTLVVAALMLDPGAAFADDTCNSSIALTRASEQCDIPGKDAQQKAYGSNDSGHVYRLELDCGTGGQAVCAEGIACVADDGESGFRYTVYEDGNEIGSTCLSAKENQPPGEPTPAQVMDAARSLSWPQATLVIQPPGGETLVNFATNFYTPSTDARTQTVPLLDMTVTIEATPSAYTWHFGDGHDATTHEPGAPYPHLTITHAYLRKGSVSPALDVTYSGRYRFGDGPWKALPDTLTVQGTPQLLTVRTATPHLVDSD